MKKITLVSVVLGCTLMLLSAYTSHSSAAQKPAGGSSLVYVGSYTGPQSKGIYAFRFEASTGELTPLGVAAETPSPSFLALHPNRQFLYAANEINNFEGQRAGSVSAFTIDAKTGKLSLLNQVSTRGLGPCFVTVDKTGKNVLATNYGGGSVAVLPIGEDGRLRDATAFIQHSGSSVNPGRQNAPHAHSINLSPDNRFAIVADLGIDKLMVYRFDAAKGTLAPNEPAFTQLSPGAGPRHVAFHPNGKVLYGINELQSTISVFDYDTAAGTLKETQTAPTLPADFKGQSSTAEVQVHPNGKFVYGSNRGHDSIAVFAADSKTGKLTLVEHVPTQGRTPRNFRIDPTGRYLFAANQDGGNVVIFRLDPQTGRLTPTGKSVELWRPVCVKFLPLD